MADAPHRINWTQHALVKADLLGVSRSDIEDTVRDRHAMRTRNPRSADWQVKVGRIVVAQNHPDGDDSDAALVVTLWRT